MIVRLRTFIFLLFLLLPHFATGEVEQWDTLTLPPGAELDCQRLLESAEDNSFHRDWARTEAYQKQRWYENYQQADGRMLEVPRPILKILFPSMTLPYSVIGNIKNIEAYELRGFCPEVMKAALDPTTHLVIATSVELEEATVRNCIRQVMTGKIKGAIESPELLEQAVEQIFSKRIHLFNVGNPSSLPLSQKFLQSSEKKAELKSLVDSIKQRYGIPDEGAFMQTFVTTPQEGWVADYLGVSVWGNPLLNAMVENKSTYHKIAERSGIRKADAIYDIFGHEALAKAILQMLERNMRRVFAQKSEQGVVFSHPLMQQIYDGLTNEEKREQVQKLMQKWNQGTSGQGNAPKLISEEAVVAFLSDNRDLALNIIRENLTQNMKTANPKEISNESFVDMLATDGGVVEQFVPYVQTFENSDGEKLPISPSGQADIRANGITLMGCHEQKFIPGVPGGVFLGAIYGWSRLGPDICRQVYQKTLLIGKILKQMGYLGRFAIDFVVARDPVTNKLEVVIIEINARSGGTHTVDAMVALTLAFQFEERLAQELDVEPHHWYAQVDGDRRVKLFNEGTDNFYHKGLMRFCSDQELLDFLYQRDPKYWKRGEEVPMANSLNKRGILPHMIQARKGVTPPKGIKGLWNKFKRALKREEPAKGKMGFVSIGHDSYEDAHSLFESFSDALVEALDNFEKTHRQRRCM